MCCLDNSALHVVNSLSVAFANSRFCSADNVDTFHLCTSSFDHHVEHSFRIVAYLLYISSPFKGKVTSTSTLSRLFCQLSVEFTGDNGSRSSSALSVALPASHAQNVVQSSSAEHTVLWDSEHLELSPNHAGNLRNSHIRQFEIAFSRDPALSNVMGDFLEGNVSKELLLKNCKVPLEQQTGTGAASSSSSRFNTS